MKLLSTATLLSLAFTALASSSAHALSPAVKAVTTYCAPEGSPAMSATIIANAGALTPIPEHTNVQVEVSVDDGPWTLISTGALTVANSHTFTASVTLPDGSLSVRVRVRAVGAWSSGWVHEAYTYAIMQSWEGAAGDFAVPTDCAPPPPPNPGTGTPGYWKNHPEAWPVDSIVIGGVTYSLDEAIAILSTPTARDVTYTMARALIAAELNALIGNDVSCIEVILDDAQAWMTAHAPGSGVRGRDAAWVAGEALASELDAYNNGELCAAHRD